MIALPPLPDESTPQSLEELYMRLQRYLLGLDAFLRDVLGSEIRTFESDGTYPIYVETQVADPVAVIRVGTYELDDPETTVDGAGIGWRKSSDSALPGLRVDYLEGLQQNTRYTCTILILGKR